MKENLCEKEKSAEPSKRAPLYLAPSSNGDGWGVFSSQPISKGDIVELAPLLLRFSEENSEVLRSTILNNYYYQYWAWNGVHSESQFVVSFGYMLYFNHSSRPNIKYQQFGREPDIDNPGHAVALGYYALCDIPAHVELLCDYGGPEWFQERGMMLIDEESDPLSFCTNVNRMSPGEYKRIPEADHILTSKLYSGYDDKAIEKVTESHVDGECEVLPYNMDSMHSNAPSRISQLECSGFGSVRCTQDVKEGETLEVVPALVLPKSNIEGSLLETIATHWEDLEVSHNRLSSDNSIKVVLSDEVNDLERIAWVRPRSKMASLQDTVFLALAGNLSLLWRSLSDHNSYLVVESDKCNESGFLLRLVASRPIRLGERVVVKLPAFSSISMEMIVEELALTGQTVVPEMISGLES